MLIEVLIILIILTPEDVAARTVEAAEVVVRTANTITIGTFLRSNIKYFAYTARSFAHNKDINKTVNRFGPIQREEYGINL